MTLTAVTTPPTALEPTFPDAATTYDTALAAMAAYVERAATEALTAADAARRAAKALEATNGKRVFADAWWAEAARLTAHAEQLRALRA